MKKRDQTLLIMLGIIGLLIYLGVFTLPLSIYGYAKEVPVQLGHNEPGNYWILSSVISEREQFKMVLHVDDAEPIDSESQAQATSEVGLLFNPLAPISETNLEVTEYTYKSKLPHWSLTWKYTKAPAYDVNDAGWLTTARYSLSVYKDGSELTSQDVNVNYKEQRVIQLETPHGTVTVNNLGILPQGVEVPSGDLMVLQDPNLHNHIVAKADVTRMLQKWDEYSGGTWYVRGTLLSWLDVWTWASDNGYLPADINLVHVSDVTYQGDMEYVTLIYYDIVFAGDITVYIPSEMADTIIVNLFEPLPQITAISTNPPPTLPYDLPTIKEGDSFTLSVTIKNVGTEGTISVNVQSEDYAANPITEGFADFNEGDSFTFRWTVYALNTVGDSPTQLKVFAQGRGGTDERLLEGMKLDVPDYTPPDPPPPPDPTPPSPSPAIPWEVLLVAVVGVILVWLVWRRRK